MEKAVLTDEGIRLALKMQVSYGGQSAPLPNALHMFRFVPLKVKRRGVEMRLIINGGDEPRRPDPALLKAFARATRMVRGIVVWPRPFARSKSHAAKDCPNATSRA